MGILKDLMGMDFMKQGSGAINDIVAYNNYQDSMKQLGELESLYSQKKMGQLDKLTNQNPTNPAFSPTGGYPPTVNNGQNLTNVNQNTGAGINQGGTIDPQLLLQIIGSMTNPALRYPTQQNTGSSTNTSANPQVQPNPQQNTGGNPPANQGGIYPEGGVLSEDLLRAVLPGGVDKSKYFRTLSGQDNTNNQIFAELMKTGNPWMQLNGTYDNVHKMFTDQDTEMRKEIKPTEFSVGDKVYENYLGTTRQVAGVPPKLDPEIEKLKQEKLPKKTEMLAYSKKEKNGSSEFTVDYYQEVDEKGNPVFIKDPVTGKDVPKIVRTDNRGAGFNQDNTDYGQRRREEEEANQFLPYAKDYRATMNQFHNIKPTKMKDKDGNDFVAYSMMVNGQEKLFDNKNDLWTYIKGLADKPYNAMSKWIERNYKKVLIKEEGNKTVFDSIQDKIKGTFNQYKGSEDWDRNKYKLAEQTVNHFAKYIKPDDLPKFQEWVKGLVEMELSKYQ